MSNLLPCPWCGKLPNLYIVRLPPLTGSMNYYCHCTTNLLACKRTEEEARNDWNKRPITPALRELGKFYREWCKYLRDCLDAKMPDEDFTSKDCDQWDECNVCQFISEFKSAIQRSVGRERS